MQLFAVGYTSMIRILSGCRGLEGVYSNAIKEIYSIKRDLKSHLFMYLERWCLICPAKMLHYSIFVPKLSRIF
jgi:hypothetical protein